MKCLATLQLENREEIVSMVKTLHSSNLPSHEKVIQPGRSDDSSKDLATLSDPPKRPFKFSKDYHNTITGLRNFAFDGTNTVLTLEAITRDAFGYRKEEDDPRSRLEFVQREDRLEQEFFEKEQREHKNPNPRLCRLCRWIKPLVPQGLQGFVWNSKIIVPFGNSGPTHLPKALLHLSIDTIAHDRWQPRTTSSSSPSCDRSRNPRDTI